MMGSEHELSIIGMHLDSISNSLIRIDDNLQRIADAIESFKES